MAVGTSDGKYFDDEFDMVTGGKAASTIGVSAPVQQEHYTTWPEQVGKDMWDAFTLPHDVYQGETSPDDIHRVLNMAGMVTLGTMPLAGRLGKAVADEAPTAMEASIPPTAASTAPRGSLERSGLTVYDRELGRNPDTARFGQVPEDMSRGRGGPEYSSLNTRIDARNTEGEIQDRAFAAQDRVDNVNRRHPLTERERSLNDLEDDRQEAALSATDWNNPLGLDFSRGRNVKPTYNTEDAKATQGQTIQDFEKVPEWSHHGVQTYKFSSEGSTGVIGITEHGKDLYVNWIGRPRSAYDETVTGKPVEPWSVGTKAVRSLLRNIKEEFPNAETISGFRVSGVRGHQSSPARATMKLR